MQRIDSSHHRGPARIARDGLRRERGGLFQQLTQERRKFPSSSARWCTSDQKTAQALKVVTRLVDEVRTQEGIDHVIVLYCVGLRAAESPARAQKPEFAIDRTASNSRRTVIRWHPILHYSTREIWQYIRDHGLEYHWAYDAGARRLSCRLCVLATRSDLVCAAPPRLRDGAGGRTVPAPAPPVALAVIGRLRRSRAPLPVTIGFPPVPTPLPWSRVIDFNPPDTSM